MDTLLKDSPVALWRQLKIVLREAALTELVPGERIPTEQELCDRFNVSRITVRQAIASLVREGVLARQRGRGTYVLPPKMVEPLDNNPPAGDQSPHQVRLYSLERVVADKRLASKMAVPVGEPLHKIRRVRAIQGEPISYMTIYLPARFFPDLTPVELESEQFWQMLEYRSGLSPTRGEEVIECIQADRFRSDLLQVPVGSPLLVVEATAFLASGEVLEFSRAYHRADRSRLVRRVEGPQLHSRGW